MELLNQFERKILNLIEVSDEEFSKISAGLNDILESVTKIKNIINRINSTQDIENIHENMIDLQFELVNHIKQHILEMEKPLIDVINELDAKY